MKQGAKSFSGIPTDFSSMVSIQIISKSFSGRATNPFSMVMRSESKCSKGFESAVPELDALSKKFVDESSEVVCRHVYESVAHQVPLARRDELKQKIKANIKIDLDFTVETKAGLNKYIESMCDK